MRKTNKPDDRAPAALKNLRGKSIARSVWECADTMNSLIKGREEGNKRAHWCGVSVRREDIWSKIMDRVRSGNERHCSKSIMERIPFQRRD